MVSFGASEVAHTLEVVDGVLLPHCGALPPRSFGLISDAGIVAFILVFLLDLSVDHGIFIFFALLQKVVPELGKVADPLRLDQVIVAGELPDDLVRFFSRLEFALLDQHLSDILPFEQKHLVEDELK